MDTELEGGRRTDEMRERVMDLLATYYARGALELEEYERRVEAATRGRTAGELETLLSGLPALRSPVEQAAQTRPMDLAGTASGGIEVNTGEVRSTQSLVCIFSGVTKRGRWYPARNTQVLAFFGGAEIDLREACIPEGVSRITVVCAFGGATIIVPPGVNVEVSGVGIFGAFDSKVPEGQRLPGPTIKVDGVALFGGADVKVKEKRSRR